MVNSPIIYTDERSGVITRNTSVHLDRERVNQYTLNVSATDTGEPPNVASVEVIINILVNPTCFTVSKLLFMLLFL